MNKEQTEVEFQKRCERLVDREVIFNQTGLVETLLFDLEQTKEISDLGFFICNIENYYIPTCSMCGYTDINATDGEWCPNCNTLTDSGHQEEDAEGNQAGVFTNEEPREIFEWWIVSRWLAEKLNEYGEPILYTSTCVYWGRTTAGQAIKMDGVIRKIVNEHL